MRKSLLAFIAISWPSIVGSALAADMPVKPWTTPAPAFSWTSCYLGAHLGGGWTSSSVTDPVLLAQDDSIGGAPGTTVGTTTSKVSGSGVLVGGQIGCDYQFAGNWVVGVEGAVSGSTMRGNVTVGLPVTGEQANFSARTDFLPSTTLRIGYAFDRVLLFAKGGAAWAGEKYTETGTFNGAGFGFEGLNTQGGWTVGAGVEWAFYRSWSASLEYDYYSFGNSNILMTDNINQTSGSVNVKQDIQVVKAAVNFHLWAQ